MPKMKKSKPECDKCFDEEGSYACVRTAHQNKAKNRPSIALVTCDDGDWEGLFINGKLITEGHSVPSTDVLDKLEEIGLINFESYEAKLDPYKHSSFEKTLEENTAAGIIDEPRPR